MTIWHSLAIRSFQFPILMINLATPLDKTALTIATRDRGDPDGSKSCKWSDRDNIVAS
jgi:hypothetical protein